MGAARGSRLISALCVALATIACAAAVLAGRAAVAAPEPSNRGVHEGVASCAGSSCHSRQVGNGLHVRQDELITWQEPSRPSGVHSRAWRVLTEPRAQAIARKMPKGVQALRWDLLVLTPILVGMTVACGASLCARCVWRGGARQG